MTRSDPHLLRTLASIPPGQRVLDLHVGASRHADPLAQLGFEVTSVRLPAATITGDGATSADANAFDLAASEMPFEADTFHWIVLWGAFPQEVGLIREARRVIRPGGWIYLSVPCDEVASRDALGLLMHGTGWVLAEPLVPVDQPDGQQHFRGIFRRVEADTAL